jgi:hypothetical protein
VLIPFVASYICVYSLPFPFEPHVLLCIFQSLVRYFLHLVFSLAVLSPLRSFCLRISVFHNSLSHPLCLPPSVVVSFKLNHRLLLYYGTGPFFLSLSLSALARVYTPYPLAKGCHGVTIRNAAECAHEYLYRVCKGTARTPAALSGWRCCPHSVSLGSRRCSCSARTQTSCLPNQIGTGECRVTTEDNLRYEFCAHYMANRRRDVHRRTVNRDRCTSNERVSNLHLCSPVSTTHFSNAISRIQS